jgi:hypothetical protein
VFVGMKWFRSNIKHGSRLALLALALQFVLPFGHFHAAAQPAPVIQPAAAPSDSAGLIASDAADTTARQPASHPEPDHRSGEACAICAVVALANTVLIAAPPILLLPQAAGLLNLVVDAEFVRLRSARLPFQPRAPPAS